MTRAEMPQEVWEYTPAGSEWWNRYAEDAPGTINAGRDNAAARRKTPLRWMDFVALALIGCAMLWVAHQFRAQRVHAVSAAAPAKFASFYNCKLMQPGIQPAQHDANPENTQFYPYNTTVCDGVQVTLWSAIQ